MKRETPHILAMNVGSSSLRFAAYAMDGSPERRLHGKIDRLGSPGTTLTFDDSVREQRESRDIGRLDHRSASTLLVDWLDEQIGPASLTGVGDHKRYIRQYGDDMPEIRN